MSKSKIILMDGAMGTMLLPHVGPGASLEGLNLTRPMLVSQIHQSYAEAGAKLLLTNTFGASRPRLSRHKLERRIETINRSGVRLARKVAGNRLVYASIGPLGQSARKMAFKEMVQFFAEQAQSLELEKPSGYLIETMTSLTEAEAAVSAVRSLTDRPIIALMTLEPRAPKLTAESAEIIEVTLRSVGATVVGANCGTSPDDSYAIIKAFSQAGDGPFAVRISGGLPERLISPDDFAEWGPRFSKLGCEWIGGCCGTTPAHIRALENSL